MLKINPDPTFTADVSITVPGQGEPGIISLTFKYMCKADVVAFWANIESKREADKNLTEAEVFETFVTDWGGVDAEFNKENIELFLGNYPAASREIVLRWQSLLLESRIKN